MGFGEDFPDPCFCQAIFASQFAYVGTIEFGPDGLIADSGIDAVRLGDVDLFPSTNLHQPPGGPKADLFGDFTIGSGKIFNLDGMLGQSATPSI